MGEINTPVSVNAAATLVYTPSAAGTPHATIFNGGANAVFLGMGTGVSATTGFRLSPNNGFTLSTARHAIYAQSNYSTTANSLVTNGALAQGGTSISVASGGAAFTAGMTIVIEAGTPREEYAVVTTSSATTVGVGAVSFAHNSGITFAQITPTTSTVRVQSGTT